VQVNIQPRIYADLADQICRKIPWRSAQIRGERMSIGTLKDRQLSHSGGRGYSARCLIGAEAQQGGDAADAVKVRLVLHIHQFHVAT